MNVNKEELLKALEEAFEKLGRNYDKKYRIPYISPGAKALFDKAMQDWLKQNNYDISDNPRVS